MLYKKIFSNKFDLFWTENISYKMTSYRSLSYLLLWYWCIKFVYIFSGALYREQ